MSVTDLNPFAELERAAKKAYDGHVEARVARLEVEIEHTRRPSGRTRQAFEAACTDDRRARSAFIKANDELRAAQRRPRRNAKAA